MRNIAPSPKETMPSKIDSGTTSRSLLPTDAPAIVAAARMQRRRMVRRQPMVGTEVGTHNPEAFPRHLVGVGAPNIDHALITAEDINLMDRFFREVLDFYATERVQTSLDGDAEYIGSWLSAGQKVHDIALIKGPQGKLHHFAFELGEWSDILRAGDLFAMDDVAVDVGPTRHGITRGKTIYFFDPSGNRNEVFSGGYRAYPDRPCVVWTPDQLAKGIFYVGRELNERFTSVLT